MCVIAIKPRNKKINYKTAKKMWDSNPDGAGIACHLSKTTIISKGYMDFKDLWLDLNNMQDLLLVVHFRLATHGDKNQAMTHPFVISSDLAESTKCYTETEKPVIVHNGIITGYGNQIISDTSDFILRVLSKFDTVQDMKGVLGLTNSKFVVMHENKLHLIGKFEKYKGLTVSNTNFEWGYDDEYYYNNYKGYGYENSHNSGKIGCSTDNRENKGFILSQPSDSTKNLK